MAMADQHDIFSKRISRINKGTGPNLMGQMLVGAADTSQHGKRSSKKHVKRGLVLSRSAVGKPKAPLIERLLGAPLALILGAGAVLIANIGVFQMYSAGRAPLFDLPVQIASSLQSANGPFWAALAVATLAILMFKIFSVTRLMAFALGFGAMIYGESLLQDRYPTIWAQLYAPQLSTPAPVIPTEGTDPVQPIVAAQNL
ncbi:hypothetical protein [Halocynthiibacter namhaensis]|uniref:hypothetical protein n=1 Tax=Halocynthiibacter namhaensis TaxID=1290553 RepID=UPI0005790C1F|nr:hypothetical protein [Halocynthiibacter namhaensis]